MNYMISIPEGGYWNSTTYYQASSYGYYWCTKANYDYFTPQLPTSSPKPKAILQLDLNNNIVATFNSASEAATILGIKNLRSKICLCCCGKQKTAGGYI